jgi:16S rRNA processing protein RimM
VRGQVSVELGSDRLERVAPGARWWARDGWLTVEKASPHQDRWLVTLLEVSDRLAAQRFTNTPIYAEPIDDPDALWVHELIGSCVVDIAGTQRGRCVSVVANPAHDLLELDDGALVPVTFIVRHEDDLITIDPPDGLFDDGDAADSPQTAPEVEDESAGSGRCPG